MFNDFNEVLKSAPVGIQKERANFSKKKIPGTRARAMGLTAPPIENGSPVLRRDARETVRSHADPRQQKNNFFKIS